MHDSPAPPPLFAGRRVLGLAGWSGSGKTALLEALVADLAGRGLAVVTIKHTHHDVDPEPPGKDSRRARAAGARESLLAGPRRWIHVGEENDGPEPGLEAHLARLGPAEVILVEGFKHAAHPRIAVHRAAAGHPPPWPGLRGLVAVATDVAAAELADPPAVPVLPLDEPATIAAFVRRLFRLDG